MNPDNCTLGKKEGYVCYIEIQKLIVISNFSFMKLFLMQQLEIAVVSDQAYLLLCFCLQSGSSAESWNCLSSAQAEKRDGHPKSAAT